MRALQRYDLDLDLGTWANFGNLCQPGRAKFLKMESASRSHWLIHDQFIVVYNKKLGGICTFLPPEAIWEYIDANKIQKEQSSG